MTNQEEQAREMFDEFMNYCETHHILPQYIMGSYLNEEFWKNFQLFWAFNTFSSDEIDKE